MTVFYSGKGTAKIHVCLWGEGEAADRPLSLNLQTSTVVGNNSHRVLLTSMHFKE